MSPLRLKGEELSVPQDKDTSPYWLRDANKSSYWREESWAITHTAVFFALTQSQASEITSESAGYFKTQSSNSPPKNIFSVDIFKAGFLILSERLTCCDRRIRGFGGSSEPDSSPAQHLHPAQPCMSHLEQGLRQGKEPQEGFLSTTTPVLLWVTGSWGGHQLQRS